MTEAFRIGKTSFIMIIYRCCEWNKKDYLCSRIDMFKREIVKLPVVHALQFSPAYWRSVHHSSGFWLFPIGSEDEVVSSIKRKRERGWIWNSPSQDAIVGSPKIPKPSPQLSPSVSA